MSDQGSRVPKLWLCCPKHPEAGSCWVSKGDEYGIWCYECRGFMALCRDFDQEMDLPMKRAACELIMHWEDMLFYHPDRATWDFSDRVDALKRSLLNGPAGAPL